MPRCALQLCLFLFLITSAARAGDVWDGGGGNGNWNNANNWNPDGVPTSSSGTILTITGNSQTTQTQNLGNPFVLNRLVFSATTNFTLNASGNPLEFDGISPTIENLSGGNTNITVRSDFNLRQNLTLLGGGTGGQTVLGTFGSSTDGFIDDFGGGRSITVTGNNGTFGIFNTINSFSGGVTLNAGSLVPGGGTSLGSGTLTVNGGLLRASVNGSVTVSNSVVVNASFILNNGTTAGSNEITFDGPMRLNVSPTISVNGTPANSNLNGVIDDQGGGFGFIKTGTRTLTLGGAASNTFTGTVTVNDGILVLAKTGGAIAVQGPLSIGDGTGLDILRLGSDGQVASNAAVTINGGVLDLATNSASTTIGALSMTGGGINTGTGTLTLNGDVAATTLNGTFAAMLGRVDMNAPTRVFTVTVTGIAGPSDLIVGAVLSGNALEKQGNGTLVLSAANTYTGLTTVSAGTLEVEGSVGAVAVNGGTLRGPGAVGDVNATAGDIAPGDAATIGTLTAEDVTVGAATVSIRISGFTTAGTDYDVIDADSFSTNGATLELNLSGLGAAGTAVSVIRSPSASAFTTVTLVNNPLGFTAMVQPTANGLDVVITDPVPTAVISSTATDPTRFSPIPVTVTFSEPVTGFVEGDVVVGNGTISGFAGDGTTFIFNVTPAAQGLVTVDVPADVAQDSVGQLNLAATFSRTFDSLAPGAPTNVDMAAVSDSGASNSDNITNVTHPQFTGLAEIGSTVIVDSDLDGIFGSTVATGGAWQVSPNAPLSDGVHNIRATATDAAGNRSDISDFITITVDTTAPTVTVTALAPVPTRAGPVAFKVAYAGASTIGLAENQVSVVATGTAAAGTVAVSGSGVSERTVTLSNLSGAGTLTISVAAGSAVDLAGNTAFAATANASFTVDNSTATTLAADPTATLLGRPVTLTATVAPTIAGATPTGQVTFRDGASVIGTAALNGAGVATITSSALAEGARSITAEYAGDTAFAGSVSAAVNVTIGAALALTSGPLATPNPAEVGVNVTFTAASNTSGTVFNWNFGDGVTQDGTNGSATHAYAAGGLFTATVTAVHPSGATATGSVAVRVLGDNSGDGIITPADLDTDGDGFTDGVESALNTSPTDAASTPDNNQPQRAVGALTIVKAAFVLDGDRASSDSASLQGVVPVPAGFSADGKRVLVEIGGAVRTFTLNRGKGKSGAGSIALKIRAKKGVVAAQSAPFTVALKKESLRATILQNSPLAANGAPARVSVYLLLDGAPYRTTLQTPFVKKGKKNVFAVKVK